MVARSLKWRVMESLLLNWSSTYVRQTPDYRLPSSALLARWSPRNLGPARQVIEHFPKHWAKIIDVVIRSLCRINQQSIVCQKKNQQSIACQKNQINGALSKYWPKHWPYGHTSRFKSSYAEEHFPLQNISSTTWDQAGWSTLIASLAAGPAADQQHQTVVALTIFSGLHLFRGTQSYKNWWNTVV